MILIILIGLDQDYQEIQPNRETRGVAFHLARENPDKPDMRSHEAHRLLFPPFFLFVSVIAQNPSGLSGLATARSYLSSQTPELMVSISTVSTKPFGFGGKPHKPRPTVENTPRIYIGELRGIATTPFGALALAREATISLLVNGKPETIDVVCDPRNYGGDGQRFFLCPVCSRKVQHLYLPREGEQLTCRRCAGLTYRSQLTKRRGLHRARDLRRKLGASEELLAPLPPRPRQHMAAAKYDRLVGQLVAAEAVIASQLHDMVVRVRRRLKHDRYRDRDNNRARTT